MGTQASIGVYYFKKKPPYRGYYVVAAQDEACAIKAIERTFTKPAEFYRSLTPHQKQSGEVYYPFSEGYVDLIDGDVMCVFEGAMVVSITRQGVPTWEEFVKQPEGYGVQIDNDDDTDT